jgi:hypothetical protein
VCRVFLHGPEDFGYFALEGGEFSREDGTAWVQNQVYRDRELWERGADGFAHAALDAVAIDGFSKRFGDREADARAFWDELLRVLWFRYTNGVEVADGAAKLLAAGLVNALVISVFAKAMGCEGRGHRRRQG